MDGYRISEIATALSGQWVGDGDLVVAKANEPALASDRDLAVAMDPRYGEDLSKGQARTAILWEGADWQALGLEAAIFVQRPRLAMAALTQHLKADQKPEPFIHPNALIAADATLAPGCRVDAFAVIGAGVYIGAGTWIGAHVTIGTGAELGTDCVVQAGGRIGNNVVIGDRFHGHPGCVIGADGFSFVTAEKSAVEEVRENLGGGTPGPSDQTWLKIQSLGSVRIGDDVEIGANSSVDAGTLRATGIGDGTKIDALVQVGHNVQVGRNCLLCAHVAVGGSACLGDGVVLGGQAGVADNITIGDGVVAGGGSKILSNVPKGRAILGYPATRMETELERYKLLRRLPRLLQKLKIDQKPVPKRQPRD